MQRIEAEFVRPLELVDFLLDDFFRVVVLGPEPLGKDLLKLFVRILDVGALKRVMVSLSVHDVGHLNWQSLLLGHEPKNDRCKGFSLAGQLLFVILGSDHSVENDHCQEIELLTS